MNFRLGRVFGLALFAAPAVIDAGAFAAGWPAVNSPIPAGREAISVQGHVDTNAELKTVTGADFPGGVRRLGFYAPGDGGGATYYWSATNCAHADDGGQVQPSVAGCWIGDLPVPAVVQIWGARGDGTTNDTTAFNNADLWASRANGAIIGVPAGTYIVSCGTTPWVRHSNTFFKGVGENTSIVKLCAGSSTDLMQTVNVTKAIPQSASTTPLSVPTPNFTTPSNVTFDVPAGLTFTVGEPIQAVPDGVADRSAFITGHVFSYAGTKLTMTVERGSAGIAGALFQAWYITQVGNTIDIKAGDGEVNGPTIWSLDDIRLDGNAENNTANPNGRCIYSYAKSARFRGNVTVTNCWGMGWEQHGPPALPTFPNDNGINYISNLYLVRANQRNVPDYPGGIGGGGMIMNGPTDFRVDNLVLGWITGGYQLKTARWGAGRFGNVEFGGGGWSDGKLYLADVGYINECDTGSCFTASQLIVSNATYKTDLLIRKSGFHATGGYSYANVVTVSKSSRSIPTTFPTAMTFTVGARWGFVPGQTVYIRPSTDTLKGITGTVTSYDFDTGLLSLSATAAVGTGAYSDWLVGPGFYKTFIQVGDAANGFGATDIDLDTYCQDCNYNNIIRFDKSGGYNRIRLRAYDNYTNQPNAGISGTFDTNSDEFAVHIDRGGNAFTHPNFVLPLEINFKPAGRWTPTIYGLNGGSGTIDDSKSIGIVTQNGSNVHINARVEWTSHNISGDVQVGGLPVPALANGKYNGGCTIIGMGGVTFNGPAVTWLTGVVQFTRQYAFFVQHGSNQVDTTLTGGNLAQSGYIDFDCNYIQ